MLDGFPGGERGVDFAASGGKKLMSRHHIANQLMGEIDNVLLPLFYGIFL